MRVPPPGDTGPVAAGAMAQAKVAGVLAAGGPDRRSRYWAAMVSGRTSLEAVLRQADAEQADLANRLEVAQANLELLGRRLLAVESLAREWEHTDGGNGTGYLPDPFTPGRASRRLAAALDQA